tara:strand:- start:126 stop:326 length:201 start_codon:yes stop_codon:yes gene_type:complete
MKWLRQLTVKQFAGVVILSLVAICLYTTYIWTAMNDSFMFIVVVIGHVVGFFVIGPWLMKSEIDWE